MNKKIGVFATTFTIICVISLNVFANKTDELIDSSKLSKSNKDFLFKGATNLVVLNEEEMKETEGEFVPLVWLAYYYGPAIISTGAFATTRYLSMNQNAGATVYNMVASINSCINCH